MKKPKNDLTKRGLTVKVKQVESPLRNPQLLQSIAEIMCASFPAEHFGFNLQMQQCTNFGSSPPTINVPQLLTREYHAEEEVWFLAYNQKDEIIGFSFGHKVRPEEKKFYASLRFPIKGDEFYLGEFVVLPNHRRSSVGRQLYLATEDYAKSMGFKDMIASCMHSDNKGSPYEFWTEMGFHSVMNYLSPYLDRKKRSLIFKEI